MKNMAESFREVIDLEESKSKTLQQMNELDSIFRSLDKLPEHQKPMYSIPLADTLGKGFYANANKHN